MTPTPSRWQAGSLARVSNLGNLVVGILWRRLQRPADAWRVLSRQDDFNSGDMYGSTRTWQLAQVARDPGSTNDEIAWLRQYVAMRQVAEPAFRSELLAARERLAQLTRR